MEKALVALSFDDGRMDNYTTVLPILKKYNLPASFNITTGYIEGVVDCKKFEFPSPMKLSMVRKLFADKQYEIAGHGYYHINTEEDIIGGISALCKLLKTDYLYCEGNGFASPGSDFTVEMYRGMKSVMDAHDIRYVRLSCRYLGNRWFKVFLRKVSRIIKWPWIYKMAYSDSLMSNKDDGGVLYSIPILSDTTPSQIRALIDRAVKKGAACVLMFHSVVPESDVQGNWYYSQNCFEKVFQTLSYYQEIGILRVTTTMGVSRRLNMEGGRL